MTSKNRQEKKKTKRKSEDDFQECEDVLHQIEKNELVNLLKSCWGSKHEDVQFLIQNAVSKKQKKDEDKRRQIEQDKKDIYETNWVFPDETNKKVDLNYVLNIPGDTIKLGYYNDRPPLDVDLEYLKWDDAEGKLIIKIPLKGCGDCNGAEVITVVLERSAHNIKKRVKVTSIGECYCTYHHGSWLRYEFDSGCEEYGYPKEEVDEIDFVTVLQHWY